MQYGCTGAICVDLLRLYGLLSGQLWNFHMHLKISCVELKTYLVNIACKFVLLKSSVAIIALLVFNLSVSNMI